MKTRFVSIVVGALIIVIFAMNFETIQYQAREIVYKQSAVPTTAKQEPKQCWI
jgi:hypothetical protein